MNCVVLFIQISIIFPALIIFISGVEGSPVVFPSYENAGMSAEGAIGMLDRILEIFGISSDYEGYKTRGYGNYGYGQYPWNRYSGGYGGLRDGYPGNKWSPIVSGLLGELGGYPGSHDNYQRYGGYNDGDANFNGFGYK